MRWLLSTYQDLTFYKEYDLIRRFPYNVRTEFTDFEFSTENNVIKLSSERVEMQLPTPFYPPSLVQRNTAYAVQRVVLRGLPPSLDILRIPDALACSPVDLRDRYVNSSFSYKGYKLSSNLELWKGHSRRMNHWRSETSSLDRKAPIQRRIQVLRSRLYHPQQPLRPEPWGRSHRRPEESQ